jgi:hypothetical protein
MKQLKTDSSKHYTSSLMHLAAVAMFESLCQLPIATNDSNARKLLNNYAVLIQRLIHLTGGKSNGEYYKARIKEALSQVKINEDEANANREKLDLNDAELKKQVIELQQQFEKLKFVIPGLTKKPARKRTAKK